ncbi:hypothetical protein [Stenotrophomonas sp.]|nr:hypothetical protein [Stenotrophomonas sp.]
MIITLGLLMLICGIAWSDDALLVMALLMSCTHYLGTKIDKAAQRGREE